MLPFRRGAVFVPRAAPCRQAATAGALPGRRGGVYQRLPQHAGGLVGQGLGAASPVRVLLFALHARQKQNSSNTIMVIIIGFKSCRYSPWLVFVVPPNFSSIRQEVFVANVFEIKLGRRI